MDLVCSTFQIGPLEALLGPSNFSCWARTGSKASYTTILLDQKGLERATRGKIMTSYCNHEALVLVNSQALRDGYACKSYCASFDSKALLSVPTSLNWRQVEGEEPHQIENLTYNGISHDNI